MTDLNAQLHELARLLSAQGRVVATAESCTGGGIAHAMTELARASAWFERGFVTYSNDAKCELLGVRAETLQVHGAVSEETVLEMARGALARSPADISVAVTGVAGPAGGSPDKPVGTVWVAWADNSGWAQAHGFLFPGDRRAVREATVVVAVAGLNARLGGLRAG